ncbi:hypothetical protein CJ263_19530 [Maribacter cobaltidurans]|uniref:Uncharacterized protein n=1 Tax=Maribacter cobaltidurans TaxID=1178778 RepID=A0A223VAQ7_9FLAO|nr:hypothetical protein CJ263_19530 [Maribacter cobaltidurans]
MKALAYSIQPNTTVNIDDVWSLLAANRTKIKQLSIVSFRLVCSWVEEVFKMIGETPRLRSGGHFRYFFTNPFDYAQGTLYAIVLHM